LLGVGGGIAFITLTGRGIAGVADEDAGAASGLVNVFHQVGGCLGIAVMTTLFTSASRVAAHTPASHSLAHSVSAALTGSAISVVLALLVIAGVPRRPSPVAVLSDEQPEAAEAMAA
jgi:hypothetical protein